MNNAWELANEICRRVSDMRVRRAGIAAETEPFPLTKMSDEDKQPWLDTARVVIEMRDGRSETDRLRSLCDDWDRYTMTLQRSPTWCNEMRRAVVVEMMVVMDKLAKQCQGKDDHD